MKHLPTDLRAVLFDTFGTTVDWHSGLAAALANIAGARGISADWGQLAIAWHTLYVDAMGLLSNGSRPWMDFDGILRESLDRLLQSNGLDQLTNGERDALVSEWSRLPPWEDAVAGLLRIKSRYTIGPLSNGHVAMLTTMAKHGGLPWDLVLSSELFHQYKPHPSVYRGACTLLRCRPDEVMLVASHEPDLRAASRKVGMRTAYVHRPREFGTPVKSMAAVRGPELVVSDFLELAKELGV